MGRGRGGVEGGCGEDREDKRWQHKRRTGDSEQAGAAWRQQRLGRRAKVKGKRDGGVWPE